MKNRNIRQGQGVSLKTLKRRIPKKSKKLLVPLDNSPTSFRALKHALSRTGNYIQKITCIYVVPSMKNAKKESLVNNREIRKVDEKFLKNAKTQCEENNVEFSHKILYGNPGKEIVGFAKRHNINEIIIGYSNKSKLSKLFLGSTSNYVINKTKLPVTLIK